MIILCVCCDSCVSPSFKESHIKGRRVEVDKLEDEHLEDESVVILGLCSVHLCNTSHKNSVKDIETMLPLISLSLNDFKVIFI